MYAPARVRPGLFAPASLPTTASNPRSWGARQLFRKSRCADRGYRTHGGRRDRARHRRARMRRLRRQEPDHVRWGRGQAEHLFGRERRRRRNARRHVQLRRRLSQRILRRRRLLQHRLHRHVHGLQRPGIAGDVHVRSRGRRAARVEPMSRVGRVHLRPGRHVRRQRRLPEPRRGYGVQGRRLLGGRGRRRQRLRRAGTMQGGAGDDLRALQLRSGDERLRRRPAGRTPTVSPASRASTAAAAPSRLAPCARRTTTARPGSAPTASAATSPAAGRASAAAWWAWPERAGRSTPGPAIRTRSARTRVPPRAGRRAPATASAAARCTPPRRSAWRRLAAAAIV